MQKLDLSIDFHGMFVPDVFFKLQFTLSSRGFVFLFSITEVQLTAVDDRNGQRTLNS